MGQTPGHHLASLARLGVRNPHSLRHTYASELLRRGRTLEEIQYFLGHANIATTNIYARLRTPPDVLASLESEWEAFVNRGGEEIIFKLVKASHDEFADIETLRPPGKSGQMIQTLFNG